MVRCGTRPSSRVHSRVPHFNTFFAAVINVTYTRFKAEKGIMDALVHLRKKKGAGGLGGVYCRRVTPGAMPLWGMLYADDAEVVSQSPEQLRKIIGVIVVECAAFGRTVSEAKTEIISLRVKGMSESTAIFSVEAAGKCTTKRTSLYTSGERQRQCRPVYRSGPAHVQRMVQIPKVYPRNVRPTERSPRLKPRMLTPKVLETTLYGCVTWSPRACHNDTLRQAHHRFVSLH